MELGNDHTTYLRADKVRVTRASEFWPAIERACCGSMIDEIILWRATSGYAVDSGHSQRVIMLPSPHSAPPGWSTSKLRSILHRASAGNICFVPGADEYLLLPDKVSNLQQLRTQLAARRDGQSMLSASKRNNKPHTVPTYACYSHEDPIRALHHWWVNNNLPNTTISILTKLQVIVMLPVH